MSVTNSDAHFFMLIITRHFIFLHFILAQARITSQNFFFRISPTTYCESIVSNKNLLNHFLSHTCVVFVVTFMCNVLSNSKIINFSKFIP